MSGGIDADLPFDKRGIRWALVFKVAAWIAVPSASAGGLWLASKFASHEEVRAVELQVTPLVRTVASMEEFRERQEKDNVRSDLKFEYLRDTLTDLKSATAANREAQLESNRRMFEVLDRIERRQQKTPQ